MFHFGYCRHLIYKFDDVAHRMLKNILSKNFIVNEMTTMAKINIVRKLKY